MTRQLFCYFLLVCLFAGLTGYIVRQGDRLPAGERTSVPKAVIETAASRSAVPKPAAGTRSAHGMSPLGLLLCQLIVILAAGQLFGWLATSVRQPVVVGEMVAGICLGPSLAGWLAPGLSHFLFPPESMETLLELSQVGLVLFMFITGMELEARQAKRSWHQAVMISHSGIVIPFFLGVVIAYVIYRYLLPEHGGFLHFALFFGTAMSITAFPVLARIVQDNDDLRGTALGNLALSCAAADDVTAWCILAVVIATVKAGSPAEGLLTIGLAICFVGSMFYLVKPALARWITANPGRKPRTLMAACLFIVLCASLLSERIGIHALFGAFIAGTILPREASLKRMLKEQLEPVCTLLWLPIFFAYTGLRMQISLLSGNQWWVIFGLIMAGAVIGKLAGSTLTARVTGLSWRDALAIGTLMNTRGLMELIVLNIGYELGILSAGIFAVMVLMALATTLMTGPLIRSLHLPRNLEAVT